MYAIETTKDTSLTTDPYIMLLILHMINNSKAILIKCQIKLYIDDAKAWGNSMEHGTIMILSIISVAAIAAVTIEYYQTASDKVVGAQCDKSKLVCRVRSETTHFGGYQRTHTPTFHFQYMVQVLAFILLV
jgi:hypothetical protein